MSVSSNHKGKRGDFSQYIFLSMKGKKVKQSSSFATDGEQDQLKKNLFGVERKNCRDVSVEGITTPTSLGCLCFLA